MIELHSRGSSYGEISKKTGISPTSVWSIISKYEKTGKILRKEGSGR